MLRPLVAIGVALFAIEAHAQVSGSVALLSDYRFRGISLSDDRPAANVTLSYDQPSVGWYAGGALSSVRADRNLAAQLLGYAGYARRVKPDLSWEAGVTYSRLSGHESYAYAEAYVGLAYKRLVARVYYAPDYFHSGIATQYGEINGSHALSEKWYLFAHLGYLRRNGDIGMNHSSRVRSDIRAGLGLTLKPLDVQLGWTGVHGSNGPSYLFGYPVSESVTRDAWIINLSYAW
ncbi:TorF family putative porin [Dyella sp. 20L07]|uniref:TorF family putative porin n=1 Tax=Dyella sp. 20L07 TaxID=3384240 RepID=UPI003D2719C7